MRLSIVLIGLGLAVGSSTSVWAVDPAIKCEADKLKAAGKYSDCRLKAESIGVKKQLPPDFEKCDLKYDKKWAKAEAKEPDACPSLNDANDVRSRIIDDVDTIAALLAGDPTTLLEGALVVPLSCSTDPLCPVDSVESGRFQIKESDEAGDNGVTFAVELKGVKKNGNIE